MEGLKNQTQIRFADLIQEMKLRGFNAARVSKLLGKSHASVSQYLAGNSTPPPGVMSLLERIVAEEIAREHVQRIEASSNQSDELRDQLTDLARNNPDGFAAAKVMINALHQGLPPERKVTYGRPMVLHAEKDTDRASAGAPAANEIARAMPDKKKRRNGNQPKAS